MTWAQNTTSGVLTHSGTTATVWIQAGDDRVGPYGDGKKHYLHFQDFEDHISAIVLAGDDYHTGWQVGIMNDGDAVDTDITIRRLIANTPENKKANTAHGLTAGVPGILEITVNDGEISVTAIVNGVAAATATWTNDQSPTYLDNTNLGFISDVDGAVITRYECSFIEYPTSDTNETWAGICDGKLWACYESNAEPELIGSVPFPSGTQVSGAELGGEAVFVGGGYAVRFDPLARTITPYTPTSGSLPGATGPGTTSAFQVIRSGARIGFLDRNDRQCVFTAVGDLDDINTGLGLLEAGAAFSVGAGGNLRFGEDLIGAMAAPDGTVTFACRVSMFSFIGDPADSQITQIPITLDSGASNWAAMVPIDVTGRTMMHSPDGCVVINNGGPGSFNLTGTQLRGDMDFRRDDRSVYRVQLIRDTRRRICHVFRTLEEPGSERSVHWAYFEDVGKYADGRGGFFRTQIPEDCGPTSVVNWNGRVCLGGRDGFVREFGEDATVDTTDDGTAITAYMPVSLIDIPGIVGPVKLTFAKVLLTDASDPVLVRVYGGANPEQVWDRSRRRRRFTTATRTGTNGEKAAFIIQPINDGALVMELSPQASGGFFALEQVDVNIEAGVQLMPARTVSRGHAPCRQGTALTYTDDPWTPTAGGDGGHNPPTGGGGTPPTPPDDTEINDPAGLDVVES